MGVSSVVSCVEEDTHSKACDILGNGFTIAKAISQTAPSSTATVFPLSLRLQDDKLG
jgi:hypothetical protein